MHSRLDFDTVHNQVKSWRNIVQVAASDAFFALDDSGRIHLAAFSRFSQEDYRCVLEWTNVQRIITGSQNSVIGITTDGFALCAGANLKRGLMGNAIEKLTPLSPVVDVFPTGSECEEILVAFKNGRVEKYHGIRSELMPVTTISTRKDPPSKILDGAFWSCVVILNEQGILTRYQDGSLSPLFIRDGKVVSFAVGHCGYGYPFVLAVIDK